MRDMTATSEPALDADGEHTESSSARIGLPLGDIEVSSAAKTVVNQPPLERNDCEPGFAALRLRTAHHGVGKQGEIGGR